MRPRTPKQRSSGASGSGCGAHGHELPLDRWATKIGTIGTPFDPATHLGELLGAELDREALVERRRARHRELIDLEDLRPGVDEYLSTAIERGLRTAIVSSSDD